MKLSAQELLDSAQRAKQRLELEWKASESDPHMVIVELAQRVEGVLAEVTAGQWDDETAQSLADRILRKLNGKE
jgi:hypothetical protein